MKLCMFGTLCSSPRLRAFPTGTHLLRAAAPFAVVLRSGPLSLRRLFASPTTPSTPTVPYPSLYDVEGRDHQKGDPGACSMGGAEREKRTR